MLRRGRRKSIIIFVPLIILGLMLLLKMVLVLLPDERALKLVDKFYHYEQQGRFSESWELFHPFMKEKFPKGYYLQDRAHVFMNHFGVETFTYTLGKPKKLKKWRPTDEGRKLKNVYKVPVIQSYKGTYGNFSLHQEVFVVREKEKWFVLWDYQS